MGFWDKMKAANGINLGKIESPDFPGGMIILKDKKLTIIPGALNRNYPYYPIHQENIVTFKLIGCGAGCAKYLIVFKDGKAGYITQKMDTAFLGKNGSTKLKMAPIERFIRYVDNSSTTSAIIPPTIGTNASALHSSATVRDALNSTKREIMNPSNVEGPIDGEPLYARSRPTRIENESPKKIFPKQKEKNPSAIYVNMDECSFSGDVLAIGDVKYDLLNEKISNCRCDTIYYEIEFVIGGKSYSIQYNDENAPEAYKLFAFLRGKI